jgi:hypothetical protein
VPNLERRKANKRPQPPAKANRKTCEASANLLGLSLAVALPQALQRDWAHLNGRASSRIGACAPSTRYKRIRIVKARKIK